MPYRWETRFDSVGTEYWRGIKFSDTGKFENVFADIYLDVDNMFTVDFYNKHAETIKSNKKFISLEDAKDFVEENAEQVFWMKN